MKMRTVLLILAVLWAIFLTGPAILWLTHPDLAPDPFSPWTNLLSAAVPLVAVLAWSRSASR